MVKDKTLAFIGLGRMGFAMASHLGRLSHPDRGGYRLAVYNRDRRKGLAWQRQFADASGHACRLASSPADAARRADMVMVCVGGDKDVGHVIFGDGDMAGIVDGVESSRQSGDRPLIIDHSTTSAIFAKDVSGKLAKRGIGFLDAPLSGGQAGAMDGQLIIMVGAAPRDFTRARPVLAHYSREIAHMGDVGTGQLTKMVNQICVASVIQGLAEGIDFGRRANIDLDKALRLLCGGAAGSWQMRHRGETMVKGQYDFGFAVDWMRKDLSICLAEAKTLGARLEGTKMIDRFYAEVQKMGHGNHDTSSLLQRLDEMPPRSAKTARSPKR